MAPRQASHFHRTNDLNVKTNFHVIGAMKCATTSLCNALACHPDVFFTSLKEPEIFYPDDNFAREWSWYELLFARANGEIAMGEGTTSYAIDAVPESGRANCQAPSRRETYLHSRPHPLDGCVISCNASASCIVGRVA